MTTTPIVKLVHGSKSINLISTGEYWPIDFTPPTTQETPTTARGTVQNRYSGSQLVSTTANDTAFSFVIDCYGTTEGEAKGRARKLSSFIKSHMGDKVTPLQIHYRGNSDVAAEPLWGEYGANSRFTITYATVSGIDPYYMMSDLRGKFIRLTISAMIRPFADGLKMRLGSATGGVLEDTLGSVDGRSRGLIIPEATTNKMTNPVFGNATYDTGWTTGGDLGGSENTDSEFVLFGTSSAKLTRIATGGSGLFTQSINVGNTNTHVLSCYVRKPDGSSISSSDGNLYYGANKTTTWTAVGNGWYRATASVTGINAATPTGINAMPVGTTLYFDGFQIEEKSYVTPLAYGDMLGCAWTGTAHASTTTRTVAYYRNTVAGTFDTAEWTIRLVWKAPLGATGYSSSVLLFDTDTSGQIRLYFQSSDDKFYLEDNTNTIGSSSAQTFSAGDILIIHAVAERGSLKIYVNGSQDATGSTYTPPTLGTYWYLGSNTTPAQHCGGTFYDCSVYDYAATATEVLNDYTNIAAIIADGERVGCIPWLWTKDGDNVTDGCDDSTRDNYAVCGGVPGSVEAKTQYRYSFNQANVEQAFMAMISHEYSDWIPPAGQYYNDLSGTADANSSGGQYQGLGILDMPKYYTIVKPELFNGKPSHLLFRAADSVGAQTGTVRVGYSYGSQSFLYSSWRTISLTASMRMFYGGEIQVSIPAFADESQKVVYGALSLVGGTTTNIDFFMIIPGKMAVITTASTEIRGVQLEENTIYNVNSSSSWRIETRLQLIGDTMNLEPSKMNIIITGSNDGTNNHTITDTVTYSFIDITPRYALL